MYLPVKPLELTAKQQEILDTEFDNIKELQEFWKRSDVRHEMNKLEGGVFVRRTKNFTEGKGKSGKKGFDVSKKEWEDMF